METDTTEEEPRRLADFLRTHRETILSDWLTAVRSLAPARRLDRPMLIDHLPQYLDDLRRLPRRSARRPTPPPSRESAGHARPRAAGGGLTTCRRSSRSTHSSGNASSSWSIEKAPRPCARRSWCGLHSGIDRAIVTSTARYHEASERTLRALDRISSAALTHRQPEKMLPELLKVLLETCAASTRQRCCCSRETCSASAPRRGSDWRTRSGEMVSLGHSLAGRVAETRAPVSSTTPPTTRWLCGNPSGDRTARLLRRTDDVRRRARRSGHNWVAERGRILRGGPPPFPYYVGRAARSSPRPAPRRRWRGVTTSWRPRSSTAT